MKAAIQILIISFLSINAYSQTGNVEIIKDARIDALVKKQGMVIPPATSPQITGYRVQLFFDSDRKLVDEARSKFVAAYPKVDSYVVFTAPNYVLKVGDFRSELEAERIKDNLFRDFPTSFIVKELVNLPRIDQD
ncbi:MAG: hypothetical protein RLZ33_62 [Bacteroidota bacterium]|jgi:hypothetical protein